MNDKNRALETIAQLASDHQLSLQDIAAVLESPTQSNRSTVLVRVLSYLGGTFVFAGIGIFIALQWDDLGSIARIIVTLGPGLAAFALALLALHDQRYLAAVNPLLIISAIMLPMGMHVAFAELGSGGDWRIATMVTSATVGLQFGLTYLRYRRTDMLLFAVAFATIFLIVALDKLGMDDELIAVTVGASVTLAGIQIHRSKHNVVSPAFFLFGGWAFLWGCFDILENSAFEIIFLGMSCATVYLGVWIRSRTLNLIGTVAVLAYVAYFTHEHFASSLGWPIALIMFGLILIGVSAIAVRIDRKYIKGNSAA